MSASEWAITIAVVLLAALACAAFIELVAFAVTGRWP